MTVSEFLRGADARDKLTSVVLGEYDGGRGTSDSVFHQRVPGRLKPPSFYFEGGEMPTFIGSLPRVATTDQVLVNAADDNSVKAYRKFWLGPAFTFRMLNPVRTPRGFPPVGSVED